ncbi:MAG: type II secretion system protein [Planctomycetota bacterium]|jgi:prepilin-type N-terminal cleavage/methylation domain-containing protein/prepilin-type processing-associated H-X9-DG protein
MNKSRGFTLIELLVVISIIALLMAILMPTLSRARELAAEAVCMANLKQWGVVYSMYISDNDGHFPKQGFIKNDESYWENDKLLYCPLATKEFEEGGRNPFLAWRPAQHKESKFTGSYGVNQWCGNSPGSPVENYKNAFWKTVYNKGSENIPLFFDCSYIYVCPLYTDAPPAFSGEMPTILHFGGWGHNPDALKGACIDRHNGSINMLFVDMQEQSPPIWPHWMRNFKDYYTAGMN